MATGRGEKGNRSAVGWESWRLNSLIVENYEIVEYARFKCKKKITRWMSTFNWMANILEIQARLSFKTGNLA
jgi:hypothetical protein